MISLIMFIIITSMTKMTDEVTKQLISSAPLMLLFRLKNQWMKNLYLKLRVKMV